MPHCDLCGGGGGDDTSALRRIDARYRVLATLAADLSLEEAVLVVEQVHAELMHELRQREEARLQ
jgi:hypothetical protein